MPLIVAVDCLLQEMDGLRNPHINKFLPPQRNGKEKKQSQLSFVFDPIVDLNLPDREQYVP